MNPISRKPFYVGVGNDIRCGILKRNRYHEAIVNSLPDKKFIRILLYKDIDKTKAFIIEQQIIKKCGRICNSTGYLANIHTGGELEMNNKNFNHWLKGKKMVDVLGTDYVNSRKGKSYDEQYGDKKIVIIKKQTERRMQTIQKRKITIGQTDKEKQRGENKMHRIKTKGFTEREISSHQQTRERQSGKTMRERLGDINYIDPRKGKSATEIQGNAYVGPWNKGRTITELKGQNYVDPRCKPFTITSHLGVHEYKNEREFLTATNFASPLLTKLKRIGKYTVKRQSNTLHPFEHGETILYNTL
jgi:hypothetical protein